VPHSEIRIQEIGDANNRYASHAVERFRIGVAHMINAVLDADRIEDGAILKLEDAPSKWNEGDAIVVRRDGSIVTQLVALDDAGQFSWSPSAWLDFHIRLERVDDKQARIWLRPYHRDLLSRMQIGGYR
jgi:hypothetical protein